MHTTTTHPTTAYPRTWAPFMVINPGETLIAAAARHRRDTGHVGSLCIVAINPAESRHLAAA